jgi:endonuclease III
MAAKASKLAQVLDRLGKFYGKPAAPHPTDPFEMILYINCAYPATDAACEKAFAALKRSVGLRPDDILAAPDAKFTEVGRLGGAFAGQRGTRLKEIAAMVKYDFGGDLRAVLKKPQPEARKALKKFPTIGDPSADKIFLFTKTTPVAAIPSNCVHVPVRLGFGEQMKNYAATYGSVQQAFRAQLPKECGALIRAYLLFKQHGKELCKRSRPLCEECPVSTDCRYFTNARSGGAAV